MSELKVFLCIRQNLTIGSLFIIHQNKYLTNSIFSSKSKARLGLDHIIFSIFYSIQRSGQDLKVLSKLVFQASYDDNGNSLVSLYVPSAFQMQELSGLWLATHCPRKSYGQHQGYPHLALGPQQETVHKGTNLPSLLVGSMSHWDQPVMVSEGLDHLEHGRNTHNASCKTDKNTIHTIHVLYIYLYYL